MSKSVGNPYPGSRAFQQADHGRFCGREAEAAAIVGLWTTQPLTIVTGPVASGKTSLLQAGVYPLMSDKRPEPLPVGRISGGMTFPFAALPDYNPYTLALLRSWAPDETPSRLAGLTVSDFVRGFASHRGRHVFAAIDQVDDLAVDPPSGSRRVWWRQFLGELAQAYADHPHLHLLLCARSEASGIISTLIGLISTLIDADVQHERHELRPLTIQDACEAVARPAESAKRKFADGAAQKVVDELRHSRIPAAGGERYVTADHVEPALLQAVCTQLWRDLPLGVEVITEWEVREFSDVDSTLATYCATVIMQVAAEHDLSSSRLHSWMLDTFVTGLGTLDAVPEGALTTAQMTNAVVRSLVDRHLLSSEMESTTRSYRLLAERLIEPLRHAKVGRPAAPTAAGYLRAAERELSLGDVDLAQRHAMLALGAKPDLRAQADAESLLGNVAHEQGKPSDALPHYREAASFLAAAGDTKAAASELAAVGQTLLTLGHVHEAVAELQAAVARAPSNLVLQTQLALALWQLGKSRPAVAILNGVLGIDGGNPEALQARGEILADLGDAGKALLDLKRPSMQERPSTRAARGLALAELGDYSAASKVIRDALEAAPRNGRVLLYAARASAAIGDSVHSGELARDALDATDPPLSEPHRQLAKKLAGYALGLSDLSGRLRCMPVCGDKLGQVRARNTIGDARCGSGRRAEGRMGYSPEVSEAAIECLEVWRQERCPASPVPVLRHSGDEPARLGR
jgi:tetratricopeptide (TPR) repeat protein